MQKQRIILIVGIAMALVVVFMIKRYLDIQERLAEERAMKKYESMQANQLTVLFAKRDIAQGTSITANDLETKTIHNSMVEAGAVTSLDRISGMVVTEDIVGGEQITLNKLTRLRKSGDLASVTPVGKRAVSIEVDQRSSFGGLLKPGDYVDLIAAIPIIVPGKKARQMAMTPLFQNVLVLAVGRKLGMPDDQGRYSAPPAQGPQGLITVALTPHEANLMAFVQEQTKIRLFLRSPTDAKIEAMRPANWEALFQYLMPRSEPEAEIKSYVEIYRGLRRERIPLIEKE